MALASKLGPYTARIAAGPATAANAMKAIPIANSTTAVRATARLSSERPATANLGAGQQLLDLSGDGQQDLVEFGGGVPGFYERTTDEGWESFSTFHSLPRIDWSDPNLRFVDLTGDGHADVLITEEAAFRWYPSLAEDGFSDEERVIQSFDEEATRRVAVDLPTVPRILLIERDGDVSDARLREIKKFATGIGPEKSLIAPARSHRLVDDSE